MKFNLEETVTGADFRPNAALLTLPRTLLEGVLQTLTENNVLPDAFSADGDEAVLAVFWETPVPLPESVTVTEGFFRLTLQGRWLSRGTGSEALWTSVLADNGIRIPLSCADCNGITQYLADVHRPAVKALLRKTFGV